MRPLEMFSKEFRELLLEKIDAKIAQYAGLNPCKLAILTGMNVEVATLVLEKGKAHLERDTVYGLCVNHLERNMQTTRGPGPLTMDEAVTIEAMVLDDQGSEIPHAEVIAERGILSAFNLDAYRVTDGEERV